MCCFWRAWKGALAGAVWRVVSICLLGSGTRVRRVTEWDGEWDCTGLLEDVGFFCGGDEVGDVVEGGWEVGDAVFG